MKKVDIFGVKYAVTDYAQATAAILENAKNRNNYSVYALPVHGVVEARTNPEFKQAVDRADLIVPDGQPIRWMMNYLYKVGLKERVYGPRLLDCVLSAKRTAPFRVFVYGGRTENVLSRVVDKLQSEYPKVEVCGAFREASASIQTLSSESVACTQPDLVIVGLGLPNQEKWIAQNSDGIPAPVMGVGAAFGFFSGDLKSAPRWMQKRGMEWLYRLITEPRRLWKRYLYTNSYFVALVIRKVVVDFVRDILALLKKAFDFRRR